MTHTIEVPGGPTRVAVANSPDTKTISLILGSGSCVTTGLLPPSRARDLAGVLVKQASSAGQRKVLRTPHSLNFTAEQNWGEGEI